MERLNQTGFHALAGASLASIPPAALPAISISSCRLPWRGESGIANRAEWVKRLTGCNP